MLHQGDGSEAPASNFETLDDDVSHRESAFCLTLKLHTQLIEAAAWTLETHGDAIRFDKNWREFISFRRLHSSKMAPFESGIATYFTVAFREQVLKPIAKYVAKSIKKLAGEIAIQHELVRNFLNK